MGYNKENTQQNSTEIELIPLLKHVWSQRIIVVIVSGIFIFIGFLIAIKSKDVYKTRTVFITQESKTNTRGFSGLAAMAGVNFSSQNQMTIVPIVLYPVVVSSVPFQKELMYSKLFLEGDSVTLIEYRNRLEMTKNSFFSKRILGFPKKYMGFVSDDVGLDKVSDFKSGSYSKDEFITMKWLNERVHLIIDEDTECITIETNFNSAEVTAKIANIYLHLLQKKIIEFRTKKSFFDLEEIETRYLSKKKETEMLQLKLATYQDNNMHVSTVLGNIKFDRLNSEYILSQTIYAELAKQYEHAKLQLKKDTPVFVVLKPASVPLYRSDPNRVNICIISLFLGLISGCLIVIMKLVFKNIVNKWIIS
ncbi:hypothetical protein K4L44_12645 [Halosquirtibacter laminarini]|uniref:Uncharacterized protein n=1 Tax=Halosquirtibacter laminarini TaxID=3374600 RepID=A0AC61ND02_9BACT|nr:hypothetical protein K4L44_12645 [Prolixibacteraceae bacterium]